MWLLTTDNRRIALLYMTAITTLFLVGGLLGTVMRLELTTPDENLVSAAVYGRIFSMHGIIMVFFVLIPAIPSVLGSFLLPRMIGSRGLAFPRLALVGWYLFAAGGLSIILSLLRGGVDTGWTFYRPYIAGYTSGILLLTTLAVMLALGGMILLGINFIATVHRMRAKGLIWSKLPLLVWSLYATGWIVVIAAPVMMICLVLLIAEQSLGLGIFNPTLGGDPVLFQRLFWFFGRPALYVMILPAIGIISELLAHHSRGGIFGYRGIVYSIVAIAVLGFLTSGSHLFVTPQSVAATLLSSFIGLVGAVPFVVILFSWLMTLYRGAVAYRAPMLYVLGFLALMTIGGLSGLFLSATGISVHLHSTYFVLAHFHYLLAGAVVMAYLGGLHFWWQELSGRSVPESLSKISAVLVFCGINMSFLPQFILGFLGMPRRYSTYPVEFEALQVLATAGIPLLALGYLSPMIYFGWGLIRASKSLNGISEASAVGELYPREHEGR